MTGAESFQIVICFPKTGKFVLIERSICVFMCLSHSNKILSYTAGTFEGVTSALLVQPGTLMFLFEGVTVLSFFCLRKKVIRVCSPRLVEEM